MLVSLILRNVTKSVMEEATLVSNRSQVLGYEDRIVLTTRGSEAEPLAMKIRRETQREKTDAITVHEDKNYPLIPTADSTNIS